MKKFTVAVALMTSSAALFSSILYANNESATPYKIYVFKDCKQLDIIPMTQAQIDAYKQVTEQEIEIKHLEQPIKQMESELAQYEQQLEQLSKQAVLETADKLVMNKELVKQQVKIASQIQQIVSAYQPTINAIQLNANKIEMQAKAFEQLIKPSIAKYSGDDISINIGKSAPNWQCNT